MENNAWKYPVHSGQLEVERFLCKIYTPVTFNVFIHYQLGLRIGD